MTRTISNDADMIDSRDVIERIEELTAARTELSDAVHDAWTARAKRTARKALAAWNASDDAEELRILIALANEAEGYAADWQHGGALIRRSYFVDYIRERIHDCYALPKQFNSSEWPWRHITFDYEAAAREAEQDYTTVDFDGVEYLIR